MSQKIARTHLGLIPASLWRVLAQSEEMPTVAFNRFQALGSDYVQANRFYPLKKPDSILLEMSYWYQACLRMANHLPIEQSPQVIA